MKINRRNWLMLARQDKSYGSSSRGRVSNQSYSAYEWCGEEKFIMEATMKEQQYGCSLVRVTMKFLVPCKVEEALTLEVGPLKRPDPPRRMQIRTRFARHSPPAAGGIRRHWSQISRQQDADRACKERLLDAEFAYKETDRASLVALFGEGELRSAEGEDAARRGKEASEIESP